MKYSACIDMMFSRLDFDGRIAAVEKAGLDTVEFWKWSNKDIDRVADELQHLTPPTDTISYISPASGVFQRIPDSDQ